MAQTSHGEGGTRGAAPDTLRWALGETRSCACPDCWERRELWRQARILVGALDRARPGAAPAELADFVWSSLRRGARFTVGRDARRVARAARWLREYAAREGWNLAQLYEVVLRGLARNR